MKLGPLTIVRADGKPMTVRGQERIDTLRRGGFGKMADRAQAKLDAKSGKK